MAPGYGFQVFLRVAVQNQVRFVDKVLNTQPSGTSRNCHFRRKRKIRTLLLSEKSSDFVVVVHLQGLEPWAHWLRETNVQQSSISGITQIRCFYRFIVNLRFASTASFAPVIPSCIRYPAVPVCKKCAKMCRAKISPLNRHWVFMQSRKNGRVQARHGSYNLACSD